MFCKTSCLLSSAFIASSVFMNLQIDKKKINDPLIQLLDSNNKKRYHDIVKERRNIYFKGFALGLILSLFALYILNNNKSFKITKLTNICTVLSISFIVNYFFYILHPKTDYMVLHLESKKEKEAWLNIYKTMQFNYHLGFVLGLIGMGLLGNIYCR